MEIMAWPKLPEPRTRLEIPVCEFTQGGSFKWTTNGWFRTVGGHVSPGNPFLWPVFLNNSASFHSRPCYSSQRNAETFSDAISAIGSKKEHSELDGVSRELYHCVRLSRN